MKHEEKRLYNGRTHLGNVLNLLVCFVLAGVKQVQPADGQLELELFRFVLPRCVLTSLFLGTSPQCLMNGVLNMNCTQSCYCVKVDISITCSDF